MTTGAQTIDDEPDDTSYSLADLPVEAFSHAAGKPLDVFDGALAAAPPGLQRIVLIEWFGARYCDPAEDTPYNGREGGYQFIHGGPYDPADELFDRFGEVVDDAVIQHAVDHLHAEVGDEWAPIRGYDEDFDVQVDARDEPAENLARRVAQAQEVLQLKGPVHAERLALHWAYSAIITALETYLWETLVYWIDADERVLEGMVTEFDDFRSRNVKLGEIFKRRAGLKAEVRAHLQGFVWHRWGDVARMYKAAFGFDPPSFAELEEPLLRRHDIVHRNSQTRDGQPVVVLPTDVEALAGVVARFAAELEARLPSPPPDFDGVL